VSNLAKVGHTAFPANPLLTQYASGLVYQGESGALNEHFSDVFGTAITQWSAGERPEDADWLIGDEIMAPDLYGEALRSMRNPGTAYDNPILGKDPQPARYADRYTGTADNGGVHINSGIPNRVFYRVATELGDTVVTARMWYHALHFLPVIHPSTHGLHSCVPTWPKSATPIADTRLSWPSRTVPPPSFFFRSNRGMIRAPSA